MRAPPRVPPSLAKQRCSRLCLRRRCYGRCGAGYQCVLGAFTRLRQLPHNANSDRHVDQRCAAAAVTLTDVRNRFGRSPQGRSSTTARSARCRRRQRRSCVPSDPAWIMPQATHRRSHWRRSLSLALARRTRVTVGRAAGDGWEESSGSYSATVAVPLMTRFCINVHENCNSAHGNRDDQVMK